MTLSEFKQQAEKRGTVEMMKTCNNYGFGGSFSTYYMLGDYIYRESLYRTLSGYIYKEHCLTVLNPWKEYKGAAITKALKLLIINEY